MERETGGRSDWRFLDALTAAAETGESWLADSLQVCVSDDLKHSNPLHSESLHYRCSSDSSIPHQCLFTQNKEDAPLCDSHRKLALWSDSRCDSVMMSWWHHDDDVCVFPTCFPGVLLSVWTWTCWQFIITWINMLHLSVDDVLLWIWICKVTTVINSVGVTHYKVTPYCNSAFSGNKHVTK